LQIGSSPFSLGTVANTSANNSIQNSVQFDPHFATSFTYKIPKPSDISQVGGNELAGGWIPVSYATGTPASTYSGVLSFSSGDGTLPAPLTTIFGVVDIEYEVDFKLAE